MIKRLLAFFRRDSAPPPAPKPADFFCIYCNAKFPHDELDRVVAHLRPHASREEAEARLHEAH